MLLRHSDEMCGKIIETIAYVVALEKRNLIWDLLIDQIEKNVLKMEA